MYIDINTQEYPLYEGDIRRRHPQYSSSRPFVPPEGYALVEPSERPAYDPMIQAVREIAPTLNNGTWTQTFEVYSLTQEEVDANRAAFLQSFIGATQNRLDTFAQTRGYDGILAACTYAISGVPKYQEEGAYCISARDATWQALYAILEEIESGTRIFPSSFEDVEGDLPRLTWPEVL